MADLIQNGGQINLRSPVTLDLLKLTNGTGPEAVVFYGGSSGSVINRMEIDGHPTQGAVDAFRFSPDEGTPSNIQILSGYARLYNHPDGVSHQDVCQSGAGLNILIRDFIYNADYAGAPSSVRNTNMDLTGFNGGVSRNYTFENCSFGPRMPSTVYIRSSGSGHRFTDCQFCAGLFFTFRNEASDTINTNPTFSPNTTTYAQQQAFVGGGTPSMPRRARVSFVFLEVPLSRTATQLGQPTNVAIAQPIAKKKRKTVGQAAMVGIAQPITRRTVAAGRFVNFNDGLLTPATASPGVTVVSQKAQAVHDGVQGFARVQFDDFLVPAS